MQNFLSIWKNNEKFTRLKQFLCAVYPTNKKKINTKKVKQPDSLLSSNNRLSFYSLNIEKEFIYICIQSFRLHNTLLTFADAHRSFLFLLLCTEALLIVANFHRDVVYQFSWKFENYFFSEEGEQKNHFSRQNLSQNSSFMSRKSLTMSMHSDWVEIKKDSLKRCCWRFDISKIHREIH